MATTGKFHSHAKPVNLTGGDHRYENSVYKLECN